MSFCSLGDDVVVSVNELNQGVANRAAIQHLVSQPGAARPYVRGDDDRRLRIGLRLTELSDRQTGRKHAGSAGWKELATGAARPGASHAKAHRHGERCERPGTTFFEALSLAEWRGGSASLQSMSWALPHRAPRPASSRRGRGSGARQGRRCCPHAAGGGIGISIGWWEGMLAWADRLSPRTAPIKS